MKHLIKFNLFEEVNPKDIALMQKDFDDYFTLSFEFEIETEDRTNMNMKFSDIDEDSVEEILETIKSDLKIKKKDEEEFVDGLLYDLLDYCESKEIDIKKFEEIFHYKQYESEREYTIAKHARGSVLAYILEENYTYLKRMVKRELPDFYRKWIRKLDFVGDATLDRGIEIKPKTYLNSISNAIEILNDFYNDLEKQSYWMFSERTGLHINIGTKDPNVEWNPIKGLLLLNDFSKRDNIPLVFKDMTWRMNNDFCGSLIPYIETIPDEEIQNIKSLNLHDIKSTESYLNEFIHEQVDKIGFKNLGFNITKLSYNYVEFRYAGGVIPKDILIEKVKYFCFIIYAMTNPDFKRKEYLKKLYKFIDTL
jgi:hypothetical protein